MCNRNCCEKQENGGWMRWRGGGVDRQWKCDGFCEEEDEFVVDGGDVRRWLDEMARRWSR